MSASEHRWTPGCACFRCRFVDDLVLRDAVASVALDNDPRCQTISLDDLQRTTDERNERGDLPEQA